MKNKKPIRQMYNGQVNELENLLGAVLAPVSPRGEFVHQLQHQLESRFDPKPLFIIPTKMLNFIVFGLVGLLGGILLSIMGVKWLKKLLKSKWDFGNGEQIRS